MKTIIFPIDTAKQHDQMRKRLVVHPKNPWIVYDNLTKKYYRILADRDDSIVKMELLAC